MAKGRGRALRGLGTGGGVELAERWKQARSLAQGLAGFFLSHSL